MFRKTAFGFLFTLFATVSASAQESAQVPLADKIDQFLTPIAKFLEGIIFKEIPLFGQGVPIVLILLAGTALFLTCYFKFINLRSFGLAFKTVKGKYTTGKEPGQITHFQALTTALSATVGLGNIAGVAVAIGIGGPGAVFWMVMMGLLGMTSKFTECTLGVRYRNVDEDDGEAHGGGMFYLKKGLAERGFKKLGMVLAVWFAIACVGGALGAGNMFQINQAHAQVSATFGIFEESSWLFGLIVAVLVGVVIIGGIKSIARVTEKLVPLMCGIYVLACIVVLLNHAGDVPAAFGTIIKEAFAPTAAAGGFIGALIQGVRRGVFSNEAGVGSAAIAHAAVKTNKPASEGVVALLEPFVDTVVVCTMTALVIVVTGMWKVDATVTGATLAPTQEVLAGGTALEPDSKVKILDQEKAKDLVASQWVKVRVFDSGEEGYVTGLTVTQQGGIWRTSKAFEGTLSWFPYVLAISVFLFAFSTMISWSYYGEQAVNFLSGGSDLATMIYKVIFCICVVLGASASLGNVISISDSLFFAMVVPNLIGLYFLLPVVKEELQRFRSFAQKVDSGMSIEEAEKSE